MAGTPGPGAVKPLRDWNAADEAASGKSCLLSMSLVLVPHPVATRGSIGCEGYERNSSGGGGCQVDGPSRTTGTGVGTRRLTIFGEMLVKHQPMSAHIFSDHTFP